jgi:hypothetical protein
LRKALAAVSVLALLFAMTLPMVAMGTETTTETTLPTVDETSRPPEHFTICHFTGLAGTEHFVELNLPWVAIFGQAGHFFENGTPRAGHEEDIFGPCPVTTTSTSTTTTSSTTTTTTEPTTTTSTTTTMPTTTTTAPPTPTQFCVDVNTAPQAELEELGGVNAIIALAIIAGRPYETVQDLADVLPPGVLLLILAVNAQTGAFASDTCLTPVGVTTTTTTLPGETTTTTTVPGSTTTIPGETTTTVPFVFGAAATVCVAEVPTIRIEFQNTFPELAGQTGVLTMADVNGNVVSTQDLVYEPNTTVDLLYPGTSVNPDGTIDDVPGWILTDDGLWIRDPSDEFLREGINLTYTVNPTATAFITYPPESSECANPENPVLTIPPSAPRTPSPEDGILPLTGDNIKSLSFLAGALGLLGLVVLASTRKGRIDSPE